jgi:hypothetical protein
VDPDLGPGAFLTLGSGMDKNSRSGSGNNITDHISESWDKKYLNSSMRIRIRDLFDPGSGMEKFGSGTNIPNPQHCRYQIDLRLTAECYNSMK